MTEILNEIQQAVIVGKMPQTQVLVQQALDQGLSANEILNRALIPAMTEVGARFERSEFYVPEMLIAARAMKEGLALLKPKLAQASVKPIGRVIIGTVVGDLHDIGKNLVGIMMEGMGLEVIDLGVDVAPAKFVEAVRDTAPQIIGMSALLTTTMTAMKATIEALKAAGLRDKVKVMVGGAPVTHKFAETIGADVYASDAASAASRARALLQSN